MKHIDYWTAQMLQGNFEEAWKFSDRVLFDRKDQPCWHLPRHQQWIWNGTPLNDKRVLIRCYHGLGDTIQFIRYASLVKQIAREVIVWAQPSLIKLLETIDGIDKVLPLHDGNPQIEYDVDVEIMELAHVFRSTPETIPRKIPYVHVEEKRLSTPLGKLNVGLAWQVGNWGEERSIPFRFLLPLFSTPDVNIIIIQGDPSDAGWNEGYGYYPGAFNIYEYAQIVKGMDLVISVDSMPVHIAGSQGVPVWVLLRQNADWRWMEGRHDSPWYPSARLFRQQEEGNWESLISEVCKELNVLTGSLATI